MLLCRCAFACMHASDSVLTSVRAAGTYFARDAHCSDGYARQEPDGSRSMILAIAVPAPTRTLRPHHTHNASYTSL